MRRKAQLLPVVFIALIASSWVGSTWSVAAQEDDSIYAAGADVGQGGARVEIHLAACYQGVGPDIYEACHDDALADVIFAVNGAAAATNADGYIAFNGPPTTVTISEDADAFSAYLGAYVYCRDFTDDEVLYDDSATDSGGIVTIEIAEGDDVTCDWYNIYIADDIPEDTGPDVGVGGVTELPNTGVGTTPRSRQLPVMLLLLSVGTLVSGLVGQWRNLR